MSGVWRVHDASLWWEISVHLELECIEHIYTSPSCRFPNPRTRTAMQNIIILWYSRFIVLHWLNISSYFNVDQRNAPVKWVVNYIEHGIILAARQGWKCDWCRTLNFYEYDFDALICMVLEWALGYFAVNMRISMHSFMKLNIQLVNLKQYSAIFVFGWTLLRKCCGSTKNGTWRIQRW